jgi:hypothetical protein
MEGFLLFCMRCKAWKQESKVKVLDIKKNGDDLLVFRCPDCRTDQMAYRVRPDAISEEVDD